MVMAQLGLDNLIGVEIVNAAHEAPEYLTARQMAVAE